MFMLCYIIDDLQHQTEFKTRDFLHADNMAKKEIIDKLDKTKKWIEQTSRGK